MPPVRLACVGIDHPHGAAWRELLALVPQDIEVVALVPAFAGALHSLEERFARLPRFDDASQLVGWGEFDAALVCLPNCDAPAVCCELARAGKHLLLEKPGAARAADLQPLLAAADHAGIAFQSGYMWRYDEGADRLRAMLHEGRCGKLINIEMTYATSDVARRGPDHYLFDPAASGGGFFNWLGCHFLDLLAYIVQQPVVAVTARCGVFGATETQVEDGGAILLELAGGGLATFVGGYWLPRWAGEQTWKIRGSQRWIHWDLARAGTSGVLEIHGPQPQWHAMEETFALPRDATPGYGGKRGLALLHDWLAAIRGPRGARCRNTVQSAVRTLELLDLIAESSRRQERVACRWEPA